MQALRICWGPQLTNSFQVNWNAVQFTSFVMVTACEGMEEVDPDAGVVLLTTASPRRFIGDARFTVDNIALRQHELLFRVSIEFDHPLILWTDILLFDEVTFKHTTQIAALGSQTIQIP